MIEPYYQDSLVTLYLGRCEDVLPQLAQAGMLFDMVFTDPPYGTTKMKWDKRPNVVEFWASLKPLCKPLTIKAVFCQQPFASQLIAANEKEWRYELVWPKVNGTGFLSVRERPRRAHELVQIFSTKFAGSTYHAQKTPGKPYKVKKNSALQTQHYGKTKIQPTVNKTGDRWPTSVLPTWPVGGRKSRHATAKPLPLLEYLIATYTNPGDLILDPYVGAGGAAIAAAKLGRSCIGIELREVELIKAIDTLKQAPLAAAAFVELRSTNNPIAHAQQTLLEAI